MGGFPRRFVLGALPPRTPPYDRRPGPWQPTVFSPNPQRAYTHCVNSVVSSGNLVPARTRNSLVTLGGLFLSGKATVLARIRSGPGQCPIIWNLDLVTQPDAQPVSIIRQASVFWFLCSAWRRKWPQYVHVVGLRDSRLGAFHSTVRDRCAGRPLGAEFKKRWFSGLGAPGLQKNTWPKKHSGIPLILSSGLKQPHANTRTRQKVAEELCWPSQLPIIFLIQTTRKS